ncbi:hypothetical protein AVEN_169420-1 [Araneus ventricosus]|uniref:Helitron helicase-like domain-containing protein n=1 Tax=Araneus ventricosus TaxID=182803 RepID=A0A4Y2EKF2_ARAVE|nr:hypothetical protein AVEN_243144-1 [Araneus ventricosus]GBM28451.1 hypothetical protein AVEN_169420-1 [Araneus ventricosus]
MLRSKSCGRQSTEEQHSDIEMKVLMKRFKGDQLEMKLISLAIQRKQKNYRQHIREYNAALAFASMGAEIKAPPGTGTYFFHIRGQIYHMVSLLHSNERNKPSYGKFSYLTPVKQVIDVWRIIKAAFTL